MLEQDIKKLERLSELAYPDDLDEPTFFSVEDLQEAVDLATKYMARYSNLIEVPVGD